mmetsp:Transcript_117917/g.334367  ORF Transcript_117917/g.334367 Transcript_117917/m.334367 type:complete len:303 (+) Transcript_117917:94-1002(+)
MPAPSRAGLLAISLGNVALFVASARIDAVGKDHGDSDLDAGGLASQEKSSQRSRSEWSPGFEPKSCVEASFEDLDFSVIDAYFGDRDTFNRVCGLAKTQSPYLPDLFNVNIQNARGKALPGLNDDCLEQDHGAWKLFGEFQTGGKPDMAKVYEWGKEYAAELHARMEAHGACSSAEAGFDVSREYTDFYVPAFQWKAGFEPESCVETDSDLIEVGDIDGHYGDGTFAEICELAKTPVVSSRLFNPVSKGEIPGLNMDCFDNFGTLLEQFDGSAADSTKVQVWGAEYARALYKVMKEGHSCGW